MPDTLQNLETRIRLIEDQVNVAEAILKLIDKYSPRPSVATWTSNDPTNPGTTNDPDRR